MPRIPDRRWSRYPAGLAAALLLGGCMSNPYTWDKKNAKKLESTLEQAGKQSNASVPAEVSNALLPPIHTRMPEIGRASCRERV